MYTSALDYRANIGVFAASAVFSETTMAFSTECGVSLLDVPLKRLRKDFVTFGSKTHAYPAIDIKRSSSTLAFSDSNGSIHTVDQEANTTSFRISSHSDSSLQGRPQFSCIKWSNNSSLLAVGCVDSSSRIIVLDSRQGSAVQSLHGPPSSLLAPIHMAWHTFNDDYLASSFVDAVRIWDRRAARREPLASLFYPDDPLTTIEWSAGAGFSLLGCSSRGKVHRLRLRGEVLHSEHLDSIDRTFSLKVIPGLTATAIVTGHANGAVSVWDVSQAERDAAPKLLKTFKAHTTTAPPTCVSAATPLSTFDEIQLISFSAQLAEVRACVFHLPESFTKRGMSPVSPMAYSPTNNVPTELALQEAEPIPLAPPSPERRRLSACFHRQAARAAIELGASSEAVAEDGKLAGRILRLSGEAQLTLWLEEMQASEFKLTCNFQDGKVIELPSIGTDDLKDSSRPLVKALRAVLPPSEQDESLRARRRVEREREKLQPFPSTSGVCWSPRGDLFRFHSLRGLTGARRLTLRDFNAHGRRGPDSDSDSSEAEVTADDPRLDQCVQFINASNFEGKIDDHFFASIALRVAIAGPPEEVADRNLQLCMQFQGKIRNDRARLVAETWSLVKKLFEVENSSTEPKLPLIERCELGSAVGRRLLEDAAKRLFAAEQTQTVALIAAIAHLNRQLPAHRSGGATRVEVKDALKRSSSVMQVAETPNSFFTPVLRPIASSAAVLEGIPEVGTPTNLEISREKPGLAWKGPLAPLDSTAKGVMVSCIHAHASIFQQLRRFTISRLLEKVLLLYKQDGSSTLPLIAESTPTAMPLEVSCCVCGLNVRGLIFVCSDCGHGGHLSHLRVAFKATGGRCSVPGCGCLCRGARNTLPLARSTQ